MAPERRGSPPTPTAIRLLTNPTNKKLSDKTKNAGNGDLVVAMPIKGRPAYPMSLKPGGRGRRYWRLYWEKASWLAEADYPIVLRMCELWDIWEALHRRMLADGDGEPFLETETSRRRRSEADHAKHRVHPMLSALMHLLTQMERLEGLLGFNPVDRSRIRIAAGPQESSLDSWQRQRKERSKTQQAAPSP